MDKPPCPTEVQNWEYKDRNSGDWRRGGNIRAEGTECGGGGSQTAYNTKKNMNKGNNNNNNNYNNNYNYNYDNNYNNYNYN